MRIDRTTESIVPYEVPRPSAPPAPQVGAASGQFGQLLRGLGHELDHGEALAERAIHGGGPGGGMSPSALLALQAGIYRYSEAVDLVTKLVDRATQAVKTTLQNQ
jgi:hypothetical protein